MTLVLFSIASLCNSKAAVAPFLSGSISVDKTSKTLTAPDAESYTWYLNGKMLLESTNEITITTSGTYAVTYTDSKGNQTKKTVQIKMTADGNIITIYTIGDSTVSTYSDAYWPRHGWGQVLQDFFDSDSVLIDNRAVQGTSAKSFYNYYWKETTHDGNSGIVTELQAGDYVFIQFGINDSASDTARYTSPFGTFQEYLKQYCEEIEAKGAHPVIVTPVPKCSWTNDSTPYDAYHNYPKAAIALAKDSLHIPYVDLYYRGKELMSELHKSYCKYYWFMHVDAGEYPGLENYASGVDDDTHYQQMGAIEMARLLVSGIESLGGDTLADLKKNIKEWHKVTINATDTVGLLTRTLDYPEGLNITLKQKFAGDDDDEDDYLFSHWSDKNNDTIGLEAVTYLTVGNTDTSYTANYIYTAGKTDCNGDYLGTAYYDSCDICVEGNTGIFACTDDIPDTVTINLVHSGYCLEGNSDVTQENCDDSNYQKWVLESSDGSYKIKNVATDSYLAVSAITTGSAIELSNEAYLWRIENIDTNIYSIVPGDSLDYLVSVAGANTTSGKSLTLETRYNANNQLFYINETLIDSTTSDVAQTDAVQPVIAPTVFENNTTLYVEGLETSNCRVSIFNVNGTCISSEVYTNESSISIGDDLCSGMYLVTIINRNKLHSLKIIKL